MSNKTTPEAKSAKEKGSPLEGLKSLVLDIGVPLGSYYLFKQAGMGTVAALGWSSVFPAARTVWTAVRDRRLNAFAALILVVNLVGLAMTAVTGNARLMLAKDSAISSTVGIAVLVSVAAGRPLMATAMRPWVTKGKAARAAAYDRLLASNPRFARAERTFSLVWGVGLLTECVVKFVGAFTLPVDTMVWLGTVITIAFIVGSMVVSGGLAIEPMEKLIEAEIDAEAPAPTGAQATEQVAEQRSAAARTPALETAA